jgi:hypothetical protein
MRCLLEARKVSVPALVSLAADGHAAGLEGFLERGSGSSGGGSGDGGGDGGCGRGGGGGGGPTAGPSVPSCCPCTTTTTSTDSSGVHVVAGGLVVGLRPGGDDHDDGEEDDWWCWVACMLSSKELFVYGNEVGLRPLADHLRRRGAAEDSDDQTVRKLFSL